MKERPILMSGPMVRAILSGVKTQTRRAVRWPWERWPSPDELDNLGDNKSLWVRGKQIACPYGEPGDRLWVRETFLIAGRNDHGEIVCYRADGNIESQSWRQWKPSIFMPRRYCRIRLEVTNVRVERLQDINEVDAKAEGIDYIRLLVNGKVEYRETPEPAAFATRPIAYCALWDSLNAARDDGKFAWSHNPWVWVVEFKRI